MDRFIGAFWAAVDLPFKFAAIFLITIYRYTLSAFVGRTCRHAPSCSEFTSEAIEKLERAVKLFHAPTTLERLGECKVEVGRIVDGAEDLQRVVREDLPAGAPAAFTAAKTRAQGILKKALPRIAHLKLHVAAPPDTKATVLMDGNVYPDALLDGDRPVDPGTGAGDQG